MQVRLPFGAGALASAYKQLNSSWCPRHPSNPSFTQRLCPRHPSKTTITPSLTPSAEKFLRENSKSQHFEANIKTRTFFSAGAAIVTGNVCHIHACPSLVGLPKCESAETSGAKHNNENYYHHDDPS
jgi:hypothetical protein